LLLVIFISPVSSTNSLLVGYPIHLFLADQMLFDLFDCLLFIQNVKFQELIASGKFMAYAYLL
jgi:hypothetical protein